MDKDLLGRTIDSLSSMIDYADDGMIDKNDPNFSIFFKEVGKAKTLLKELNYLYVKNDEYLLANCINYLWEIWDNEDADTIKSSFENLGFTEEDMDYWEINSELKYIENDGND